MLFPIILCFIFPIPSFGINDETVLLGRDVVLQCRAPHHIIASNFIWARTANNSSQFFYIFSRTFKPESQIIQDFIYEDMFGQISSDGGISDPSNFNLIIKNITEKNLGRYRCISMISEQEVFFGTYHIFEKDYKIHIRMLEYSGGPFIENVTLQKNVKTPLVGIMIIVILLALVCMMYVGTAICKLLRDDMKNEFHIDEIVHLQK